MSQGGTTSGNFVYLYDGTKLRAENGAGQGFDYLGSLVYNKNGASSTLESAAFGAGRIVKTSTGYEVRYFLTDHLGSVRASIRDKANGQGSDVIDRSDYQLLGERWAGTGIGATTNRYQFNGKERQMVLAASGGANGNGVDGLNTLDGSHLLDYGARNYDPNIARWFTPDPLSEKYNSMSPYLYCAANPINTIDPDGRKLVDANGKLMWANGKWTQHATADAKRIGVAMRATSVGLREFNRIANSRAEIQLILSPAIVKNGNDITLGDMDGKVAYLNYITGRATLKEGVITIYLGSIDEYVRSQARYLHSSEEDILKAINEEIGAVGGHEANHTSDDNIHKNYTNNNLGGNYDLEIEPTRIGERIRAEFLVNRTISMMNSKIEQWLKYNF